MSWVSWQVEQLVSPAPQLTQRPSLQRQYPQTARLELHWQSLHAAAVAVGSSRASIQSPTLAKTVVGSPSPSPGRPGPTLLA